MVVVQSHSLSPRMHAKLIMQLPDLDAFTLAHLLSFLDERSHGALTLVTRACGDCNSAVRHTFLQRCIVHLPETLLSS